MKALLAPKLLSLVIVMPHVASAQDSLEEIARRPMGIPQTKQTMIAVERQVFECVPVVEHYGFRGRRSRIVYRWVQRTVVEQKTAAYTVRASEPTVASIPEAAFSQTVVVLDAPKSAGVIAKEVGFLLDNAFPNGAFPMTRQDGEFPVNFNSTQAASDGVLYQFLVRPQADSPRTVDVHVYAYDTITKTEAAARPKSDEKVTQIKTLLESK